MGRNQKIFIIDDKKLCSKCQKILPVDQFFKRKTSVCGLDYNCKNCRSLRSEKRKQSERKFFKDNQKEIIDYKKAWRIKRKLECIEKYGGKCVRCGFDDHRALQFDHVNGGGGLDRIKRGKNKQTEGVDSRYKDIMKNEDNKYQLLCANCNWIKRFENGEHRGYNQ